MAQLYIDLNTLLELVDREIKKVEIIVQVPEIADSNTQESATSIVRVGEFVSHAGVVGIPLSTLSSLLEYVLPLIINTDSADRVKYDQLTRVAVLLCCNNTQAWNARKKMFSSTLDKQSAVYSELMLTDILLASRKGSNSSTVWYHRRWVLQQAFLIKQSRGDTSSECDLWEFYTREQIIIRVALDAHPRNYFAVVHRSWVFDTFLKKSEPTVVGCDLAELRRRFWNNEIKLIIDDNYYQNQINDSGLQYYAYRVLKSICRVAKYSETEVCLTRVNSALDQLLSSNKFAISHLMPESSALWYFRAMLAEIQCETLQSSEHVQFVQLETHWAQEQQSSQRSAKYIKSLSHLQTIL
ncbi:hypothetical protein BB561_000964 [Smittium simulii]|uniref:Uncharacterized protein n=1 Tax=Smittium simulii TaxID=133385 RepID=A0A2T9YWQ9_9FUNG|nr:hypothetical protein BB561_000964 [Smittium simulii]